MIPDYTTYSLEQLRTARRTIDSERFPERRIELDERIAALELQGESIPPPEGTPGETTAARAILRRTGAVIAFIGAIQLVAGLASSSIPGSIRFEVLNLIIGALICFAGFRVISVIRWLAWLSIVPAAFALINTFAFVPLDLPLTHARLYPGQFLMLHGPLILQIVLSIWIAHQLGRAPLLEEREAAGRKRRDMRIPFALGVVFALVSSWIMFKALGGEDARRAASIAERQLGPGYRYQTMTIHHLYTNGSKTVTATVVGWNENQILNMPVRWQE